MLSVLSVPLMVAGSQPTMLTVDMAFRINAYGDYPVANALGVISYLMTAIVAWIYLRHTVRERRRRMTPHARRRHAEGDAARSARLRDHRPARQPRAVVLRRALVLSRSSCR